MNHFYRVVLFCIFLMPVMAFSQITVTIFEDLNGNGVLDAGEPGIGGLTPQLFFDQDNDGLTAEFNTGIVPTQPMVGTYDFAVVSNGLYQVVFQSTFGAYYILNPAGGISPLINYPSQNSAIAGYIRPGQISGIAWIDNNGDGLRNDPAVLPGTTITLTTNIGGPVTDLFGNPVNPVVTGPGGTYQFLNLLPGLYKLTFTPPAAVPPYYSTTYNAAGGSDEATDVSNDSDVNPANANMTFDLLIISNKVIQNIDGGYYQPGSIGNLVWKDSNGNGVNDAGEMGIAGFTVTIQYSNGDPVTNVLNVPVAPQISNAAGLYNFQNLRPGSYRISITLLPMFFLTDQNVGANDNIDSDFNAATFDVSPVVLTSNSIITNIHAGVYKNIVLSGTVWIEQDDNGLQGGSESGIAGVQLSLNNTATGLSVGTATTNGTGVYTFTIKPGSYFLSVVAANFANSQPLDGLISCTPTFDPENNVDMDDNGMGPVNGPINTTTFNLICGQEPNGGDNNNTIDFCFRFNCAASSSLAARACNQITNIICDLNILDAGCATMFSPPVVSPFPSPLCDGGGGAHNMSWFAFVAGQGNYQIDVVPISCVPGSDPEQIGIQVGVYTDCSFNNSIFCRNDCSTSPVTISSSDLTPGNTYYFWLDGCNGSVCVYEINVSSGFQPYSIPQPTAVECANGNNCSPVCPNNQVSVRVTSGYDNLVAQYEWRVTSPSGAITTVNTTTNILNYSVTELGFYKFEIIRIRNVCFSTSDVRSIMIEVKHPANENFGTDKICPASIGTYTGPLADDNGNPNPNGDGFSGWLGPANYNFQIGANTVPVSIQGCNFTQTINLVEVPLSPPLNLTYYACASEFPVTIGGQVFNSPTPFQAIFTQDVNGCDSTIFLTLLQVEAAGNFQVNGCQGGMAILEFVESITFVPGMTEIVKWKFNSADYDDGNPDGDPYTISVSQSGTYTVEITLNNGGKLCGPFVFNYSLNYTALLPLTPSVSGTWASNLCDPPDNISYSVSGSLGTTSFQWTYPSGLMGVTGQGTNSLNVNWGASQGGQICVKALNGCGESPQVCQDIVIRSRPDANFTIETPICIDSFSNIVSTFPKSQNFTYMWDLDGGTKISLPPFSNDKDSLVIKWDNPGKKYVSLVIGNSGCDSPIHLDSIEIVPKLLSPSISCTAGSNDITFAWTQPAGQTMAPAINVTTGQSGVLSGNTFTISGLVPGVTVDIAATFFVDHPCGNLTSTGSCITQSCTPEQTSFDPIPDICLTASSPVVNLKDFVNSTTTNGTYLFTGPGITNAANGTFDPNVAGVSPLPHKIRLVYTDATGCVSPAADVDILVKPTPTSDFTFDPVICQNSTSRIVYAGSITGGGVYNWDFGADVKTPGTGRGPFGVDWNTPGVKTIKLNTSLNGCPSTETTHMVTVEPRINPVSITCPIEGTTIITFDWNDVANTTGYELTLNGQPMTNTNMSNLVLTGLTVNTDYTLIVNALSTNSCPGVSDTLTCRTSECPPVFIKFSQKDTTLCLTANMPSLTINAIVTGGLQSPGQTITWTGPGVTVGANDKVATFNPNVAGAGTHTIKASLKDGICTKDTTMKITIINKPVSTFTGDDVICITDPYTLMYTGTPNLPLDWKLPSGVTVSRIGQTNNYRVNFPSDGPYILGLVTGNPGCLSDLTNLNVQVDPELDTVMISCQQTTTSVTFTWNDINCASNYQVRINNVAKGSQSALTYNVTGLMIGENVEIEILPVSTCACPAIPSSRVCTAKDCPQITLRLDSPVSRFCSGSITNSINLDATATGSNGTGSGSWSGNGVTAQGVFDPAGKAPGKYTFYYNFTEENCDYRDSISLEIYPKPSAASATVQPDCYQDNFGEATVTVTGGTAPFAYLLNNAAATPPFTALAPASYQVLVTDDNGCTATTSFVINAASEPSVAISGAASVNKGGSVELKTTLTPATTVVDSMVWTNLSGTVVCSGANCATIQVTPAQNEKYCVTVFFNGGCTITDCFEVQVITIVDVILPNIISLSGGNPSFYVQSYSTIKSVKSMTIFDRWGNTVFTRENLTTGDPAQGWDAKFKSSPVTPGVYVYKVEVEYNDGTTEIFSGDVTVIR